jgi:uncharacterized membrane protein
MTLVDRTRGSSAADTRSAQAGGQDPQRYLGQQQETNVGDSERAVSVAAGAILALLGVSRRSLPGALIAAVGGGLIYRGVTGHCPAYSAMGVDTNADENLASGAGPRLE